MFYIQDNMKKLTKKIYKNKQATTQKQDLSHIQN